MTSGRKFGRRGLLGMITAGTAALALPFKARALAGPVQWRDHFDGLDQGAILADTRAQALHVWSAGGERHRIYPILGGAAAGLLHLGRAQVVRKVEGPAWRPAPELAARVPGLPGLIPPGPENPLGSHALYLDWQGVRIHGQGARAALRLDGAGIALANTHIAELFPLARIGTPVRVI